MTSDAIRETLHDFENQIVKNSLCYRYINGVSIAIVSTTLTFIALAIVAAVVRKDQGLSLIILCVILIPIIAAWIIAIVVCLYKKDVRRKNLQNTFDSFKRMADQKTNHFRKQEIIFSIDQTNSSLLIDYQTKTLKSKSSS